MYHLIVLTAPPASGKTFVLEALARETHQKPLVLAPLRALADECRARWGDRIDVMTPEEWLIRGERRSIVIVDEFHLYLYWGDTFRSSMWEAFYGALAEADLAILLTATLNEEARSFVASLAPLAELHWIDYGNQKLKWKPRRYLRYPHRRWLEEHLQTLPQHSEGNLLFCRYRHEVAIWEQRLRDLGFRVWSCVGGEARAFSERLKREAPPQFIVATTVLSHGVNLPTIRTVYFTYAVENLDFWIQMVARGGRRGEAFDVYALENPTGLHWSRWINFLAIQVRTLKMRGLLAGKEIQAWFLKESS